MAVRHHRLRGPRGQRSHPLTAVDQRDRQRRLALRLRRRPGHPARRPQARDAGRGRARASTAARPAGRARAARARRADGSRGAPARAFLSASGTATQRRRGGGPPVSAWASRRARREPSRSRRCGASLRSVPISRQRVAPVRPSGFVVLDVSSSSMACSRTQTGSVARSRRMGREGFEPSTFGIRVPSSTS